MGENQSAAYDNREYYDSRGEFYPPRNPNQYQQGGYHEYDTRGHEQFYEPRDRRQQHSAQQQQQQQHPQYADHHNYQDQMFPSGDWGSQTQTNDYHSTVPWNQSK